LLVHLRKKRIKSLNHPQAHDKHCPSIAAIKKPLGKGRGLKVSTIHLDLLRMVHDFQWITAIESRQCPAYEMKNPPIKQRTMDRSFILDTVRQISSYLYSENKKGRAESRLCPSLGILIEAR